LAEAGLGAVARVVSGGPDVAAAALQHPAVATVAAVGGRPLGLALAKALAARPEVVLALELGGVNQALVRPDADRRAAVAAVAEGAWRMAGQRCTATRIVHVPRADCALWLRELEMARESWWPGSGSGPMIDRQSRERFRSAYRQLGSGLSLCAGALTGGFGALQEPLLLECRSPSGRAGLVYREEHFGPALIVDPYDDEADVLQRMAANPYRLAASVFTQDHDAFIRCAEALPYGQVNHNRPTAGARSDQPFGGCGRSGNGRPAALAASAIFADECVVW
jgi:acyl-CoA reductase-like NAD-dependent aldehyde dehydrogenase